MGFFLFRNLYFSLFTPFGYGVNKRLPNKYAIIQTRVLEQFQYSTMHVINVIFLNTQCRLDTQL